MLDPVAVKMLQQIPLPNLPGNVDNLQYNVAEEVELLELLAARGRELQRQRSRSSRRVGLFKADLYQDNPTGRRRASSRSPAATATA